MIEQEEEYNPTWELSFKYSTQYQKNIEVLTDKINQILEIHKNELQEVFEIIKDKQGDYKDEI